MLVLFELALLFGHSFGFFFPMGGSNGCQCVKSMSDACYLRSNTHLCHSSALSFSGQLRGSSFILSVPVSEHLEQWRLCSVPASGLTAYIAVLSAVSYQTAQPSYQTVSYQTAQPSYQTVSPVYTPTYQTVEPDYQVVQPVYQTVIPSPTSNYIAPQPETQYTSPVQTIEPVQTISTSDSYRESLKTGGEYPTITPTSGEGS
ncbi:hypothetical protein OSTOST_21929, partial [Ostertagia ostertagi]